MIYKALAFMTSKIHQPHPPSHHTSESVHQNHFSSLLALFFAF